MSCPPDKKQTQAINAAKQKVNSAIKKVDN